MTYLNKITTYFTLFLALGCTDKQRGIESFREIDFETNTTNVKSLAMSDYIDSVTYIPLTNCPVTLGRIYQLGFHQNLIVIRDLNNCILFDATGKFVSKIGNKGHGPGEYNSPGNIAIGNNDRIYIGNNNLILIFNLQGEFIRQFKPEINTANTIVRSWTIYSDSLFLGQIPNASGNENFNALIFNDRGKTLYAFRNNIMLERKGAIYSSFNQQANIYQFKRTTYFKEVINDTVFRVNNEMQFEPVYSFKLGKYSEPKFHKELGLMQMVKDIDNYIFINNVYESSFYLFLDCDFGKNSLAKREIPVIVSGSISEYYTYNVLGVFSKTTNELAFSKPGNVDNHYMNKGLYNDFDGGIKFYPSARVNDSTLAMYIDTYILKAHVASEAFKNSTPKYPEKKRELEKLANSLNENDNPVLMLVKLKE